MNKPYLILLALLGWLGIAVPVAAADYTFTSREGNELIFGNGVRAVRLQLCMPDMFRVTKSPHTQFGPDEPWMVVRYAWPDVSCQVTEEADRWQIVTAALTLSVSKTDARITVGNPENPHFWQETESEPYPDKEKVTGAAVLHPGEHFFGFGERMDFLDQLGKRVYLNVERGSGPKPAVGNKDVLRANYCPVPYFYSTRGYGLFFHTAFPTTWDMGWSHSDRYTFKAEGGEMDYYFFLGDLYTVLDRYTDLTGKSPLMPKRAYGLHLGSYSGGTWGHEQYASDDYPASLAEKMRELGIPFDLIWLDSTWRKFRQGGNGASTFEWRETFTDPGRMFRRFEEAHAWGGLHIRSILDDGDSLKLLSEARGQDILYPYAQREGLVNFFDPKAVDWWWDHAVIRITDLGCQFLKTDVGSALNVREDAPAELKYQARADHNLFPIAYAAAPFNKFMQLTGKRGFNHTREGYAGIQRYPFIWAGDWGSEWQWFEPMITGGLNIGISGVGHWSHCMGGFEQYSPRDTELYMRWVQFGMLSPVSILIGMDHPHYHEPWTYGEEALRNFITYDSLRYTLLPYIYTTAYQMNRTGKPMMRPLFAEYPGDVNLYSMTDQYLFGDWLMVCPVVTKGALSRFVYFPEGVWYKLDSAKKYTGKQYKSFLTPVEYMPMFVRGGAILPTQPCMQYVGETPVQEITLNVYPYASSSYRLFDDDGEGTGYEQGEYALTEFRSELSESDWKFTIVQVHSGYRNDVQNYLIRAFLDRTPRQVQLGGRLLKEHVADDLSEATVCNEWYYDAEQNLFTLRVEAPVKNETELIVTF